MAFNLSSLSNNNYQLDDVELGSIQELNTGQNNGVLTGGDTTTGGAYSGSAGSIGLSPQTQQSIAQQTNTTTTQAPTPTTTTPTLGRGKVESYQSLGYNQDAAELLAYLKYNPNKLSGPQFNTIGDVQTYMQGDEFNNYFNGFLSRLGNYGNLANSEKGQSYLDSLASKWKDMYGSMMLAGIPIADINKAMNTGYRTGAYGTGMLTPQFSLEDQGGTGGLRIKVGSDGRVTGKDTGGGSYWTQNRSNYTDAAGRLLELFGGAGGGLAGMGLGYWSDELAQQDKPYGEYNKETMTLAKETEQQPERQQRAQTQQQMQAFLVQMARSGKWNQISPQFWSQYGEVFGGQPPTQAQIQDYISRTGRQNSSSTGAYRGGGSYYG